MANAVVHHGTDKTPPKYSGLSPADLPRALGGEELGGLCEDLIDSWPSYGISEHIALEVAAVYRRGRPLDSGAPVPGCVCPGCTGISSGAPAWTLRTPTHAREMERWDAWEVRVNRARGLPLLEVVERLGFGDPVKRGKEVAVHCPLHDDRDPSLRLSPAKQLWFCHPCGIGGDGIELYMKARHLSFSEAVRELAS